MAFRIGPRDGVGVTLGPLQNEFTGVDEAAAITARDDYATANPSWLATYDANEFYLVRLTYGSTISYYNRVSGAWNNYTAVVQGLPGSGTDFSTISPNAIPAIGPGPNFLPYESGLTVDVATGKLKTLGTLQTGVGTLELGDMHGISSVGRQIVFVNRVKNIPYTPGSWSDASRGLEWVPLTRVGGTLFTNLIVQSDDSTEIVNPDYVPVIPNNRRTYEFSYKATEAQTNVTLNLFLDNELVFQFGPFNLSVGENLLTYEPNQGGGGFIDLESADSYRITLTSPDGDVKLLGTAAGVPWLKLTYQEWVDKELALIDDIPATYNATDIVEDTNNRFVTDAQITSWDAKGDMDSSVYDPLGVAGDAFSMANMAESATAKVFSDTERTKLAGIAAGAEANNISNTDATDLTDGGDSTLHYHASDRARANHTGTQLASTISDFSTAVSSNSAVAANTAKVSNATHTGDVTGATALTVQPIAISGKSLVTAAGGMELLVNDAGTLKKVYASDFLNGGVKAKAGGYTTAVYSVALANAGQFYKVPIIFTPYTLAQWQWDATNKYFKYTGTATKDFNINCSLTGMVTANAKTITFKWYKNGSQIAQSTMRNYFDSTNKDEVVSFNFVSTLNQNDYIELFVSTDTSNGNPSFSAEQVSMVIREY